MTSAETNGFLQYPKDCFSDIYWAERSLLPFLVNPVSTRKLYSCGMSVTSQNGHSWSITLLTDYVKLVRLYTLFQEYCQWCKQKLYVILLTDSYFGLVLERNLPNHGGFQRYLFCFFTIFHNCDNTDWLRFHWNHEICLSSWYALVMQSWL